MYIIYHPQGKIFKNKGMVIYHDAFGEKNEDPYLWNKQFLHSFCHITQMKSEIGNINFWVSGDTFPNFKHLYCDCVFVVESKVYWNQANNISQNDNVVDNLQTYNHHYKWGNFQHPFKRRRRYTLKADEKKSFQPQTKDGFLIDIVPFLKDIGLDLVRLRSQMKAGYQAKPVNLEPTQAEKLYKYLVQKSDIKIYGYQIADIHP
ncbi:hypothetical protein MH928_13465 [Flavobacterium sp. WW92]|uniref:hypothetical protein n=1 Tax=unclassified Flavobacterium TaxID=196869 RepID=UPI002225395A|nr:MULTISPECIES: hypothetical protein [unclassified Flavobacterium]WDO12328.1 hypothetical protein MH928_13465 [Flavobacterium sp. WW92]